MKTTGKKTQPGRIILALSMVIMIFAISSCSTQTAFLASSVVPAAQGKITIKDDSNKNYAIKINISNLADPQRLTPPKNVYVVWILTEDNANKNIGQIITSSSSAEGKLKASFETVSSFKPSKIFLTAENEADAQYPYSEVILTTDNIVMK
ncbi:MAG: hypothetical protein JW798_12075 [Prolixibacteraceae bacterium]|nr:hypothetical protein [Prolixibacteraceae bacterium]